MSIRIFLTKTLILIILIFKTSLAWVYPEHRDITLLAIQMLDPEYRLVLDKLWADARKGYEFRLTEAVIDATQSTNPEKLDYASWPAIAGDHSCSAKNMLSNVLTTDWILKVADVAAQLKINLANSKNRSDRINALRDSDLKLQEADPEYATRAGSNNVHFLLPLPDASTEISTYIFYCLNEGVDINAVGVYAWYHYLALSKISRLNNESFSEEEQAGLILSALADEAFALHFLEDVFAAGHVAGTWGDASQRKGTHDYYNEKGLKVSTWDGKSVVLTGDAWMRKEDAERAAIVIKESLEEFLNAAVGKKAFVVLDSNERSVTPGDLNVCITNYMPPRKNNYQFVTLLEPVLFKTPVPGLTTGLGEFPRFRAELGTFVGFAPAFRGSLLDGGFGKFQRTVNFVGGLETALRFGAGLDGVLNESGDGLAYFELGWRQDGSSSIGLTPDPAFNAYGSLYASIPGRSAFSARLRLPFYLIPGDLLILGPALLFIDKEALTKVGVAAVNGGLIPWQAGIESSFGRFQFVLGREVGVYLFGRSKERDALITYSENDIYVISYRSTQLEFPIVEYRPFRSFETDKRSSLFIQIFGGVDFPHNVEVLETLLNTETAPDLKTVWTIGLRLVFDWRHYF